MGPDSRLAATNQDVRAVEQDAGKQILFRFEAVRQRATYRRPYLIGGYGGVEYLRSIELGDIAQDAFSADVSQSHARSAETRFGRRRQLDVAPGNRGLPGSESVLGIGLCELPGFRPK